MSGLLSDIRRGFRTLVGTPAFTLGAVMTVALAVGATTAVFSVMYAVLLRQLPYRDADAVFWIWSDQPGRDRTPFNVPDFIDYRETTRTLAGLAGFFAYGANLSDEASAERVQGLRATGNFFEVLGVQARLGRLLRPDDERADASAVVVLAEPFWVRRFGGDPAIVGRTIRLNGEPYTVVGVMAAGFASPLRDGEFVIPFSPDRDPRRRARNSLNFIIGVGRLAERVSLPEAASELNATARRLQTQFPVENARKRGVRLIGVLDGIVGGFRTSLLTGFAAVAAVLLVACANLANLMLARTASRRKELAVLLALGSSRGQIVRQVLIEALLVAVAGGLLGLIVARASVVALLALAPAGLPRTGEIRIDTLVLLFAQSASLVAALLFGGGPAWAAARGDARDALLSSSRGTTGGGRRLRSALVSAEVALAVVLLVVMALLAKSFANAQAVAPGFDPQGVLSARLTLPANRFTTRESIVTFQRALAMNLAALPGASHAGAVSLLPLSGLISRVPFTVEGRDIERERVPAAQYRIVTPGYFETAGIPITRGRRFTEHDSATTLPVAIVNEALARQWLDGLDPIGARLLVDDNDVGPRPVEIIGVAGNVRQMTLDGEPTWDLYLVYPQIPDDNVALAAGNMFWIVRTTADPLSLASGLARAVRQTDPEVATSQIWPLAQYLAEAVAPRRFSVLLMAAFAVAALALAITGIYAVSSYGVSQRAREIGIRIALGATGVGIVRLVVGQSMRFVAIGVAAGLILALGASQLIATMLFGVSATDVGTIAQVSAVVSAVAGVACLVPASRAARLRQDALRTE
jgi:putative ABC transport system permease protein